MNDKQELRLESAKIDADHDQMICHAKDMILDAAIRGDGQLFMRIADRVLDEYTAALSEAASGVANADRLIHAMVARIGLKRITDSMHRDVDPEKE